MKLKPEEWQSTEDYLKIPGINAGNLNHFAINPAFNIAAFISCPINNEELSLNQWNNQVNSNSLLSDKNFHSFVEWNKKEIQCKFSVRKVDLLRKEVEFEEEHSLDVGRRALSSNSSVF